MNSQFQSLFENVCRCFGHSPTSRGGTAGDPNQNNREDDEINDQSRESILTVNSEASSVSGKKRTNKLKLNDKQYDELFDKVQRGSSKNSKTVKNSNESSTGQPPRPEGQRRISDSMTTISDHDTAKALAQAKLAANPPRYRTKRKRSAQTREEIFRNKNGKGRSGSSSYANGKGGKSAAAICGKNTSTPRTDFARLLNPSLALCFATPVRGTQEEQEEQDLKSLDHSDTATLNTNGDDTITSTLYFDSKYAHIQESTPPMPLFSQFKIGKAKDEIRTIMATDSHSSVRMIKIMEQNEQHAQKQMQEQAARSDQQQFQSHDQNHKRISSQNTVFEEAGGESSSNSEIEQVQRKTSKSGNQRVPKQTLLVNSKGSSRRMKETIKITSDGRHRDEEMEDAVPDVKPLSSSTDSSRHSNNTARPASIQ